MQGGSPDLPTTTTSRVRNKGGPVGELSPQSGLVFVGESRVLRGGIRYVDCVVNDGGRLCV